MDSETHFSIVFNIYGGSNQILPNATSATQNYYQCGGTGQGYS